MKDRVFFSFKALFSPNGDSNISMRPLPMKLVSVCLSEAVTLFSLALALKGIAYDQVPVNLVKDGGQQVRIQLPLVPPRILNVGEFSRRIGMSTKESY